MRNQARCPGWVAWRGGRGGLGRRRRQLLDALAIQHRRAEVFVGDVAEPLFGPPAVVAEEGVGECRAENLIGRTDVGRPEVEGIGPPERWGRGGDESGYPPTSDCTHLTSLKTVKSPCIQTRQEQITELTSSFLAAEVQCCRRG